MTIKRPEITVADKILMALGKKRGVRTISDLYYTLGPYTYAKLEKESFWMAFLRPKNADLPEDMADMFSLTET
jgi:hypothetical protein